MSIFFTEFMSQKCLHRCPPPRLASADAGLGGWFDEKAELLHEAGPHVSREKSAGHL